MELKQFVTDAIRTESRVESIVVNELLLTATIQNLISMGNILDQIKKHVFYGKPYNLNAIRNHFSMAEESLKTLATISSDEMFNDERTIDVNPRLFHSVVGISTEATELLEALDLYGRGIDNTNILEEFGDIDWYKAIGVDELEGDWDDILTKIIEKLRTRYPEKFTSDDAINRDLGAEREILETIQQKTV